MSARDSRRLLSEVEPYMMDGAPWWPLREICDALHCDATKAGALIAPEHKRRKKADTGRWYDKRFICMLDRQGVERLVIRYGGRVPRRELMAALDAEYAMRRGP